MSDRPRRNQKVCFITGTGHSGSTVLGLVLGSHPSCFYSGETDKTRFLHDPAKAERKRQCKLCGAQCPVWGDFRARPGVDVYEQISEKTGKPIVVDSTKNVEWVADRLAELRGTAAIPHLVFLERDGRAVINSRVRKYPERDAEELIAQWITQIGATKGLFDRFDGAKAKIRYELLATRPQQTVADICRFLGIGYDPGMLDFHLHEHHPLGGNTGAQYLVARARPEGRRIVRLSERNRGYYGSHEAGIRLDLRWRDELPRHVADLFEEMAGPLNAEFAWEE